MEYIDDEMRHKKKSRKKPPRKANHKHLDEPCVFEYPNNWFMKEHEQGLRMTAMISAYCPVCGKVGNIDLERWYVSMRDPIGCWSEPSEEAKRELDPVTRTLPTFRVKNPFVKYVEVD